jgi:Protein of unknown function (DUF2971)
LLNAARRDDRLEIKQFSDNVAAMLHGGIEEAAHYFVCCFSKEGDDLGQWRAYADNGRGFAIGFDATTLEQAFASANIPGLSGHMTFPVTYKAAELRRMHGRIVEQALPLISLPRSRVFPAGAIDPYMSELLVKICLPFLRAALFFKHPCYSNEKEYRFFELFRADADVPDVKHLPRGYRLTRYREFDWRAVAAHSLKGIVVGPAASSKARQFAKECLERFHIGTVKISRSKLPYRF